MSLNDKDSHRDEPPRREAEAPSPVDAPVEGRRDFLKVAGFSLAALAIPGCSRAPTHEAVPFVDAPEDVIRHDVMAVFKLLAEKNFLELADDRD